MMIFHDLDPTGVWFRLLMWYDVAATRPYAGSVVIRIGRSGGLILVIIGNYFLIGVGINMSGRVGVWVVYIGATA